MSRGTCYRASKALAAALPATRIARWRHHGQPKEIFVFELTDAAAEALSRTEVPAHWNAEPHRANGGAAARLVASVWARCPSAAVTGASAIRRRCPSAGYRGVNAFAQFAALLSQEQLEAVGAFWSPSKQRHRARNHHLPQHPRRAAARDPGQRHRSVDRPAQHGTCACRHGREGPARCLEADRRRAPDDGRGGGTRFRHGPRAGGGRQQEQRNPGRTRISPEPRRPHCHRRCDARPARDGALARAPRRLRVSAIKDNQETILAGPSRRRLQRRAAWHETVDKGHGRIERRRSAVDLSGAEWDGYANLHGRRQAMRIEREREILKTGKSSIEVTWSLTSLGTDRAGPEELGPAVTTGRKPAALRATSPRKTAAGRMTCPAISPA